MNEIDKLLTDYQARHTGFQIEQFIIGMQYGDWAQYKQCLREIHGRSETLIGLKEDLEIKMMRSNVRFCIRAFMTKRQKRKKEIAAGRRDREILAIENDIISTERELKKFVEIAKKLKERIGDLDPEKRAILEADSWLQKARQMAAVDLVVGHGLSKPTFEMILALPEKDKNLLLSEIGTPNNRISHVNEKIKDA